MKKLIYLAVVLSSASAFACPNLSGTFACPARNQQDQASITKIENKINQDGTTTYRFSHTNKEGKVVVNEFSASPSGVIKDGKTYKCVGNGLERPGRDGVVRVSSINKAGNLETGKAGEATHVCVRK